jgi:hypothetical protein
MHPLVRDLYKRVLHVGRDYPLGIEYVRDTWKKALRNPQNCPSCYGYPALPIVSWSQPPPEDCEREIRRAVAKGRHMVQEMIGIIQLKKYRAMKQRYRYPEGQLTLEIAMKRMEHATLANSSGINGTNE